MKRFSQYLLLLIVAIYFSRHITPIYGATLTNPALSLSNTNVGVNASHTFTFTTATAGVLDLIQFQYATTTGGNTKPANLDPSNTTLGTVSGLDENWNLNLGSAGTGMLQISNAGNTINSGTAVSVTFNSITNSRINDCQTGTTEGLIDKCYVRLFTYEDAGLTLIDTGETNYTLREDASLTFAVTSVAAGQVHNAITTSVASTFNKLPFENLTPNIPKYIAHALSVTTNAQNGYEVTVKLLSSMTGNYPANLIDPFAANGVSWATPIAWTQPTGTVANSNSGWLGANTTDTRVPGWSSAEQKFGPISTLSHPVMYNSIEERSGSTVYVTFVMGVNVNQPADLYATTVVYNILPIY